MAMGLLIATLYIYNRKHAELNMIHSNLNIGIDIILKRTSRNEWQRLQSAVKLSSNVKVIGVYVFLPFDKYSLNNHYEFAHEYI